MARVLDENELVGNWTPVGDELDQLSGRRGATKLGFALLLRFLDSTHFSAFDQNIFTEWHSRYRRAKRGVLIYWTVETGGSMAVHSQLISCSASEVHAMVEGAMRHGIDMEIEQNFVDSHGASFVGFGITRLLDFDLVARFKQINKMKLCLHILQSALGLINTLMIQDTLALPKWENVLTDADRRGLTPLFHTNMTPYGEIQLRTDRRLDLTDLPTA
ncbi:Tn3 family transposase [Streptosporangium sp. NPDC051022]|uniref:Tn3 family transposase n=1 Tax=Streptosporangium sp. NPDC051022 TaxID=3155752 RepID=UPI0034365E45